jgi:CheY-like chemotaxis protein
MERGDRLTHRNIEDCADRQILKTASNFPSSSEIRVLIPWNLSESSGTRQRKERVMLTIMEKTSDKELECDGSQDISVKADEGVATMTGFVHSYAEKVAAEKSAPTPHKKTILVVDDERSVLSAVSGVLADGDYKILMASSGSMGLQQSREFKGEIDLLLSDFQMPGEMSGVDLAIAMTLQRPQLKVLLMSGFPEGALALNEGWHFLAKPFVFSQLRALVMGLVSPERTDCSCSNVSARL